MTCAKNKIKKISRECFSSKFIAHRNKNNLRKERNFKIDSLANKPFSEI
tara:strand:+ start:734 stop:880 length:147 start_codon:yes stop_codon:yes gene_type:complete